MSTSGDEGARYLRQRLLGEVGEPGQARLCATTLRVVGGSPSARAHAVDYLARAGVRVASDRSEGPSASAPAHHDAPDALPATTLEIALLDNLAAPPKLAPARDLLCGALAAVEGVKLALGVGRPATVQADLLLFGDP